MSSMFSPPLIQSFGALIVLAALLQITLLVVSSFRKLTYEKEQRRVSLEILNRRADFSLARSVEAREHAELSWNGFRKFEIARKEKEAGDVCSFYLHPHDGRPLPPFMPGQYLTFQLRVPDQPKLVVRCYSLSDSPTHPDYYRVSIKRAGPPRSEPDAPPGLISNFFHDTLQEGDIVDVKAPSGHFFLDTNKTTPVVLIGGGIGLTPVLSMLNTICASGENREIWFFLGVVSSNDHVMKQHLRDIDRQYDNVHMNICYSHALEEDVEGEDHNHSGFVSVELMKKLLPSNNFDFYICGPPPMMQAITKDLNEWGVPEANVHFEAFGPATVKKAPKADAATQETKTYELCFDRSGKTLQWDPQSESLLDFAEANGVVIDSGCRAGNCGSCITAIKSGEVSYSIEPGAAPESGSCLTCISIPKSDLTLDA